MKKVFVSIGILLLAAAPYAYSQADHPWLDSQLKKQRYPCPPGKSPIRGPAEAQVTIVEFTDFDCPFCKGQEPILKKVLAAYPTQVKIVFKNLPLDAHPKAKQKAVLANCMGSQGLFWQAYDRMFAGDPENQVTQGADKGKLKACISQGGDGQVDADLALAKKLGMATTPGFVIDGIRQGGSLTFPQLKMLIDAELSRKGGGAE